MPNKRKKGKTKIGLWITDAMRLRLQELADMREMSISDLLKEAIRLYDNQPTRKENDHE